jgi:hypothetical protein
MNWKSMSSITVKPVLIEMSVKADIANFYFDFPENVQTYRIKEII